MIESVVRLERIENGLLPNTTLKSERPQGLPLSDRMRYFETPAVSVAIIDDYKVVAARGYGIAQTGTSRSVTVETLFQAASISKPVTAMAALKLVQDSLLDLDEDVNQYLTSWKVPPLEDSGPGCVRWQPRITLRQLLSHTAGLTVDGFPGYLPTRPIPSVIQVLDGKPPANTSPVRVNGVPGTQMRYSGGGTCIVQVLLTDVLGKPFPEIMREIVLDPLGMTHSIYEQPLSHDREPFAASAHPNNSLPIEGKWHVYPEMGAGGLWTTPSDLARFAIEVQLSLLGKSNRVLSVDMIREMLSPQVEDHVDLGLFLANKGEWARFGHSGGNEGFVCNLTAYKSLGKGAVIMTNSGRGFDVIIEFQRAIAAEYGWPDYVPAPPTAIEVSPDSLSAFVGTYELRPDFPLIVTINNGNLCLQPARQPTMPLYAKSETEFFAKVVDAEVAFMRSDAGDVTSLIFKQNGREMTAKRN